jgi:hypothetical protein
MTKTHTRAGGSRHQIVRQGEPTIPKHARIKTLESLRAHLQTAIELEHATIPPYLCALYSLQDGYNEKSAQIVKSVVLEEMLHMILAANVLNAIGGEPDLTHPRFIPEYPTILPHSSGSFTVSLEKFSKSAIETFLKIEKPARPHSQPEADNYHTIGQFYEAIEIGLKELSRRHRIFTGAPERQVTPEYYYGGGGVVIPVFDQESPLEAALEALYEITGQGEGIDHTIFDGDHEIFGEVEEYAHYFRFNEIYEERYYTDYDTPRSGPTGAPLIVDWERVYNMRPNPKMAHYPEGSELWDKTYAFNRTYMGMLGDLHRALNGRPSLLMEGVAHMYDLKYQAVELMKIPLDRDDMTAGPSFEYVPDYRET